MIFTDSNGSKPNFSKDPAVVHLGDKYFLYFSSYLKPDDKDVLTIGIAESDDMENWRFVGFLPHTQECEQNGVGAPGAYLEDGVVHLFYQTYGNWRRDAICHATSRDGVSFTKDATNPIFRPSEDWCCGRAIDADVVAFGDRLYLYFATRDHEMKRQMLGVAYAPLGSDYSRDVWVQAKAGTILEPTLDWEGKCIEAAATLVHNEKIYLFYGGAYNCSPQQIGYAVSGDGIHFERGCDTPFLPCGKAGEWNASESGHPYAFVDDDGRIYLFYQGSPDGGKSWYLSRAELVFDGDTPVILKLFNETEEQK